MKINIVVDGNIVGFAEINVKIPEHLKKRHAISEKAVLDVIATGEKKTWYCMGNVEVIPQQS